MVVKAVNILKITEKWVNLMVSCTSIKFLKNELFDVK